LSKIIATSILKTAHWLNTELAKNLTPVDLTSQQLKILSIIAQAGQEKITVNQIKQQMFEPTSNVSRMLNKLVSKNLIAKTRDDTDQRQVYIAITSTGLTKLCEGKIILDKCFLAMEKLNLDEQKVLVNLLNKVSQQANSTA